MLNTSLHVRSAENVASAPQLPVATKGSAGANEHGDLPPKAPVASRLEATHLVLPPHTNHHGTAFGGQIMSWMDIAAGISSMRHAGRPTTTVSVDHLEFAKPIRVGDVVIIRAQVNHAGRTSMEVGVRVDKENPCTGEKVHALTGYFTFVAVDADGRPVPVSPIQPETEDDKRRYADAARRREIRLQQRRRL